MLVVVSLELQVFHEISWIYQNSQDCLENSLNTKLIPQIPKILGKFPSSGSSVYKQSESGCVQGTVVSVCPKYFTPLFYTDPKYSILSNYA